MKYCRSCRRLTAGDPRFCGRCGRSFDLRVCAHGHENPRAVIACTLCRSRELSSPQQASQLGRIPALLLLLIGPALLIATIVYGLYFARMLLTDPNSLLKPMLIGLVIGILWLLLVSLPNRNRR
jgi:hypothetical protein